MTRRVVDALPRDCKVPLWSKDKQTYSRESALPLYRTF